MFDCLDFVVSHLSVGSYAMMVLLYIVSAFIYGKEGHSAMRMCYYINAALHAMLFVEHMSHVQGL